MTELNMLPDYLRQLNTVSVLLRFLLSLACGGIIGLERESKRQAAGFRTHILVCVGASMAMMTGHYIFQNISSTADPARLGAQVISGIGFLGVGTIVTTDRNKVKGLTTAAGLWAAACIGIAIGIGFYEAAVIGTVLVWITVVVLHKLDPVLCSRSPIVEFYIELQHREHMRELISALRSHGFQIAGLQLQAPNAGGECIGIVLSVRKFAKQDADAIVQIIHETSGLLFMEKIM